MKRKSIFTIITAFLLVLIVGLSLPVKAAESTEPMTYKTPYGRMTVYVEESQEEGNVFQKLFRSLTRAVTVEESDLEGFKAALVAGWEAKKERIDGLGTYNCYVDDPSEAGNLYFEILYENPQIFYVRTDVSFSLANVGGKYKITGYTVDYNEELTDLEDQVLYDQTVESVILSVIKPGMSDLEKALALHDYLAQNCEYDWKGYDEEGTTGQIAANRSSYEALVEGAAVCQGYTLAYNDLLRRVGIGFSVSDSEEMDHIWNLVEIGNQWYHVDVTWDDPSADVQGKAAHDYFLLSDTEMGKRYTSVDNLTKEPIVHKGWSDDKDCSSTQYDGTNYWNQTDTAVQFDNAGDAFYLTSSYNGYGNNKLLFKRADNTLIFEMSIGHWLPMDNNGYYEGVYSYLSQYAGYYFFNDSEHVYRMPSSAVSKDQVETIYTYGEAGHENEADGRIYGLMVKDGYMYLDIADNPGGVHTNIKRIPLPGQKQPSPVITIDYQKETLSTTAAMEYSTDNGATWKQCTAEMKIDEQLGWTGDSAAEVMFRTAAADGFYASDSVRVQIPARPNAPTGLAATAETVQGKNDGKITGIKTTMEYRKGSGAWTKCSSAVMSNLEPGAYEFRTAAASAAFAGKSVVITVEQGAAPVYELTVTVDSASFTAKTYGYSTLPAAKALKIANSGNVTATITSVASSADWLSIQSGTADVAAGETNSSYSIQPKSGLNAGTYKAKVTVTYHGKSAVTQEVSFTVNKASQTAPAAPTVESTTAASVVLKAVEGYEYRVNSGTWQTSNVFTGLTDHTLYTFYQRKEADSNHNASSASTGTRVTTLCIHNYGTEWYYNETAGTHWQVCIKCNEQTASEKHTPDAAGLRQGETEHWYVCGVCAQNYGSEAHQDADGWKHDADSHWKECSVCKKQTVPAAGHTWNEGVQTLAPTPTAPGTMLYECNVCGETREEAIEPEFWLEVAGVTFDTVSFGYELPEAKNFVITNRGNVEATISSVTVNPSDSFIVIEGGDNTVALNGTNTSYQIQPKAGLNTGTYTARVTFAYDDETTSDVNVSFCVTKATPAAPTASINYMEETLSVKAGMLYSIDGGSSWRGCTADMSAEAFGWNGSTAVSVMLKLPETQNYTESPVSSVMIPARDAAPTGLTAVNESIRGRNDGKIIGVTAEMEYRVASARSSWSSCAGVSFENMAPAAYEFRIKAAETAFASAVTRVTVGEGVPATYTLKVAPVEFDALDYGYTPAAKEIVITSTGNSDAVISRVTVDSDQFEILEGSRSVAAGEENTTYSVRPVKKLGAGTYQGMITVVYNDGTTSALVSFTVNKATSTTPEVTIDYYTEKLNTTDEMQYSTDYGSSWKDCTDDMSAAAFGWNGNSDVIVKFRIPENDNHTASAEQQLIIPARPNAPLGLAAVEEQTAGANDGQITGVTAEMEYKAAAAKEWTACVDTVITGLAPGSYVVRCQATESSFAGYSSEVLTVLEAAVYTLTVDADSYEEVTFGYTQAEAPEKALSIKNTGNRTTTITSVESDAAWLAVTGENGVEIQPGSTVTRFGMKPVTGLAAGEYKAVITVTFDHGTPVTKEVSLKVNKASQATLAKPTAEKIEATKVTLQAAAGCEYSMDGRNWQTSNVFDGLEEFTSYSFYQRKAETEDYEASPVSEALKVKTLCSHSVLSAYQMDETNHWKECEKCKEHFCEAAHEAEDTYQHDANNHWKACRECGKVLETAAHTWSETGILTGLTPDSDGVLSYDCTGGCAEKKTEAVKRVFALNAVDVTFENPAVFGYEAAPEGKVITITSSSNVLTTIDHVTTDQTGKFEVTPGNSIVAVGEINTSYSIRPKTGLEAGTHTATILVTYGNGKEVFGTAEAKVTFVVEKAEQGAPSVMIDYKQETLSVTTELEYSMNGGSSWSACTADMSAKAFGWDGDTEKTVLFRKRATDNYNAGASVSVVIPARPANAPTVSAEPETIQGWNDGKISGVTAYMEYRTASGEWRSCANVSFDAVAAGTYEFRYIAGENAFASKAAAVTVAEGAVPDYTLTAENLVFDTAAFGTTISQKVLKITSTGNVGTTITSVTLANETFNGEAVQESNFVITEGDGQVEALGQNHSYTVVPKENLNAGTYEAVIMISYRNGKNAATADVRLVVEKAEQNKPEAPVVVQKSTTSVTLAAVTGCEYSMDGSTWQSSNEFTGLESFKEYTFYQRMKETANYHASEVSEGTAEKTLCAHSYDTGYVKDEDGHWKVCLICEEAGEKTLHQCDIWKNDEAQHWQACICGAETERTDHAADPDVFQSDEDEHWKNCKECNEEFSNGIHKYQSEVTVIPTITKPGTETFTCEECGYSYEVTLEPTSCGNHVADTEAGWQKDDKNHWHLCGICEDKCDITPHSWGEEGEVIKPATYKEAGIERFTCECGAQKDAEIPKLVCDPHQYDGWNRDADGHWQVCTQCDGITEKETHDYDEGVVTVVPTINQPGNQLFTCEICGFERNEEIPAQSCGNHVVDTEAGWQKDENEHWHLCGICEDKFDAAEHLWTAGNLITEPTYTTEGLQEYTCLCGAAKEVKLPVVPCPGHVWDEGVEIKAPTLTEAGEKLYTCTLCEATRTEVIEKLADKTELKQEIEKLQWKLQFLYTAESWAAYQNAASEAQKVLDHVYASEAEVLRAKENLQAAEAQLTVVEEKAPLLSAVERSEEKDENRYTSETWDAYQEAVQKAEAVLAKADAAAEEINEALEALNEAENALKVKPSSTGTSTVPETPTAPATGDLSNGSDWLAVLALCVLTGFMAAKRRRENQ